MSRSPVMGQIEMPHAGHFICSHECAFRRNTYVNGFIISTVGEYIPKDSREIAPLGAGKKDFYETMVFEAKLNEGGCPVCPFVPADFGSPLNSVRYESAVEAAAGHELFIEAAK